MNLYVSKLSSSVTDASLKTLFAQYGNVVSAKVVLDKVTGKSRGFGFVEMSDDAGSKAMSELNGKMHEGNSIGVTPARPRAY
jgi:RNA recognition motif-containing protein